ncbi:MAG: UvrD-helicase domain-containing protein, partial [Bacteroidia bacterium]|nr:UvrD-helicase domain-containing protein [Bacteroidia bacterium]
MIQIMNASAGSGKTYNLAKTYISLLLKNADDCAYKHILAVTFTNKATAEMKNRILNELHVLGTEPVKSHYFNDFVPSVFPDAVALKDKSQRVLINILHDYGAFSISTIDKFFQMTLKAFSREIGMFASYQVELDKDSLVHESVDRILDALTEDSKELIEWLDDGVKEQLRQGARVNVEKALYEIAERLKSEEQRDMAEKHNVEWSKAFAKERLDALRGECDAVMNDFENQVVAAARAVDDAMKSAGLEYSDTYRSFLGTVTAYCAVKPGTPFEHPGDTFINRAADPDKWFSKANAKKYLDVARNVLQGPLDAFIDLFGA